MAVEDVLELQESDNFGKWHAKINEIIEALGTGRVLEAELARLLRAALEGNQISEWLADPSSEIVYPDPTQEDGTSSEGNVFTLDWNDYFRNGTFYIPSTLETANMPLGRQKDGILWCASVSETGPVLQIGATLEDVPIIAVRYGEHTASGISWKPWREIPNRDYVDVNFLNKTASTAQTVVSPVSFLSGVSSSSLSVAGASELKGTTIFGGEGKTVIVNPSDKTVSDPSAGKYLTVRIGQSGSAAPEAVPNLPQWNSSTGAYVPPAQRLKYEEPIWIDKEQGVANINGTAEYAKLIVPQNIVSEFKSWDIPASDTWKPVSAKAVKDLFDWTRTTMMSASGGVFTGVVRHEDDIFLDHLRGAQENRTAAIRSVVRPLQLQCQGSTHLISNSKQSCLYLEKEDADSAEFTTEHRDASFVFRKIVLNQEQIRAADGEFTVLNSNPESDGFWSCHFSNGLLTLKKNGEWTFAAKQEMLDALGVGETLEVRIYYDAVNALNESRIASGCEHLISYKAGDGSFKEGSLDINDIHYQIVVTDTDWEGMPIVRRSTLAVGSRLSDGTTIAAGSVINGIELVSEQVVYGMLVSYGVKGTDDIEDTPGLLTENSVIKSGSLVAVGSVINGQRHPNTRTVTADIIIHAESTLARGTILRSGSYVNVNSVLNGFQYTESETVKGQEIAEESILAPGSKILLGSLVSSASQINGVPGRAGFLEVQYGQEPETPRAEIANGTVLETGTTIAPGSTVNGVQYESPALLSNRLVVEGIAYLAVGTLIAAGSVIQRGSVINGMKWMNSMKASGIDAVLPLAKEDIAPIMYVRAYDNIHDRWAGGWEKQSYRTIYPNAGGYDNEVWKNWLWTQLDLMELSAEDADIVKADLRKSLYNEERAYAYPMKSNPNTLLTNGRYLLDKTSPSVPNNVFDMRCYVFSHTKTLGVERISVQPYRIVKDESGRRTGLAAVHDPADIFLNGESLSPSFSGEAFSYFNFYVDPTYGTTYSVGYDTQVVPEKRNLEAGVLSEVLVFRIYSDTISESGEEIASFEKTSSTNIGEMLGAPFVIGARTRTGITSEGELGDPLYDLGCIEISEDSLALKLRKRSVTMHSEIKDTLSLVFERLSGGSYTDSISFHPSVSNKINLGTAAQRFNNVYLAGDPIVSSDRSLKAEIADIPESLLKRWANVRWVSFKFKDSIKEKGQYARKHSGVVAQEVQEALKGVNLSKWSFFCRDKWDEKKESEWIETPAQTDEFGILRSASTERSDRVLREAGEQLSIRYQEMQCIENAYLRREIGMLKNELAELKKLVKAAGLNTATD